MKLHRKKVNKYKSSKKFAKNTRKTKSPNVHAMPMRGGYRL
ncbi:MAG: hypothetical protein [Microvirus sp.]|nr:MAG: hypothetical protein [Microvirus sp.]